MLTYLVTIEYSITARDLFLKCVCYALRYLLRVMSHQIHVARSDEVIWVSLEGKSIHDFYQYVIRRSKGEAGRTFLNNIWDVIATATLASIIGLTVTRVATFSFVG
jgi:hypothetical protein